MENRKRGQKREGYKKIDPRYIEYYEANYPELSHEEHLKLKLKYNRATNYRCIEYYEANYPELSHEEQEKLRKENINKCKSKRLDYIEYYEANYPELSHEEQLEMLHKYTKEHNYSCIEFYIRKYPELSLDECEKLRKERIKNANKKTNVSGVNNPNHKSKTTDKQRKERSVMCIEYYERKYPELSHKEHLKLMNEKIAYVKERHKLHSCTISNDRSVYISNGLQHYIKKYGEIDGPIKYEQRIKKWQDKLHNNLITYGDKRSCQSKFAVNIIKILCKYLNIKIPKKEKYMSYNGNHYAYDFNYKDKIIEFNGDYWHCNPELYDKDFFNKSLNKYAHEIWDKDNLKKECAEKNGYKYLVIWELEYNQSPDKIINKCKKFLND